MRRRLPAHSARRRIPCHQPAELFRRRGQHLGRRLDLDGLSTSGGGGPARWHYLGPTRRDSSHEFWETFASSSTGIAGPGSHALAELVEEWAGQRESLDILDIACGSGLYSLTLAAQHPLARATLLDWANVLEHTEVNVDRLGLRERTNSSPATCSRWRWVDPTM